MTGPFVPHAGYVARLAARADAALASVEGVWRAAIPVDVRDRAGLFHTARHVAYCARATAPDDDEMTLYRALVGGLPQRYALPAWRASRTLDRIAEWVVQPEHADYVGRTAQIASWHANRVFGCAQHEARLAATLALIERGRTQAQIAAQLGCTERNVRRLLDTVGAVRETRPRWTAEEIQLLRTRVRERSTASERRACFDCAAELGRDPGTVHAQWKRLKRRARGETVRLRPAHTGTCVGLRRQ